MIRRLLVPLLACLSCVSGGLGQDAPVPGIGRDVLASWYLDVDRAWSAARAARPEMPPEAVRRANTEFDRATLAFFRLAFAEAIGSLRTLAAEISRAGPITSGPIDQPMVLEATPRIWVRGTPVPRLVAKSIRLFAGSAAATATVRLEAVADGPEPGPRVAGATAPVQLEARPGETISADLTSAMNAIEKAVAGEPGRWRLVLADEAGTIFASETLWVVDRALTPLRSAHETRLRAITVAPELATAWTVAANRNKLLTDSPSRTISAEFLADYGALPAQIEKEISTLERGADPYPLDGAWWFSLGGPEVPAIAGSGAPKKAPTSIPCWVHARRPAGVPDAAVRMPLIIALHGAGGDESMFFRGYGAGQLTRLVAREGLVVASPATGPMLANPANFDRLVEALASWYPIDRERIYVIGHSMGAGAASSLAQRRAGKLAAAVCIAGGQVNKDKAVCPLLVIAGGLDPLIPAARLRPMAQAAIKAGMLVEFREKPEAGHTLLVGDHLDEAAEWLLRHRRGGDARDPAGANDGP